MKDKLLSELENQLKELGTLQERSPGRASWRSYSEELILLAVGKDSPLYRDFLWGSASVEGMILKDVIRRLQAFGVASKEIVVPSDGISPVSVTVMTQNLIHLLQTSNFTNIIESIQQMPLQEAQKTEAKETVEDLRAELQEENPRWDRVKDILGRLLNFGKDLFFQILPLLLEKMSKIG